MSKRRTLTKQGGWRPGAGRPQLSESERKDLRVMVRLSPDERDAILPFVKKGEALSTAMRRLVLAQVRIRHNTLLISGELEKGSEAKKTKD